MGKLVHELLDREDIGKSPQRHVIGRVVTVAASALDMLDSYCVSVQAEGQRQVGAQIENALAMGPDFEGHAVKAGQGAGGRDRGVRQKWFGEAGPQRARD